MRRKIKQYNIARKLRRAGWSYKEISSHLNVQKSTLHYWLKDISLTQKQRLRLRKNWVNALQKARERAVIWHRAEKEKRLERAEQEASASLKRLRSLDDVVVEIALAMLYLGEGSKSSDTSLGNSNPLVLKFFLAAADCIYGLKREKIRCELYLRADQNADKMKLFWSNELSIPIENFKHIHIDARTRGSKTYAGYRGVCHLRCRNIALQRRLLALSKIFCDRVISRIY